MEIHNGEKRKSDLGKIEPKKINNTRNYELQRL